ncbi:MAG: alpha-N-arabinofuranosidase, partial [Prevotella sp.]|nr:alpha-N-arabinofuranosidase [Prevotella sp.]
MKYNSFLFTALALLLSIGSHAQTSRIFVYSPSEKEGLHLAVHENGGWQHIGQLCSSDYGTWGAEKRMYDPFVARAKDGTWRLVFAINDHSPQIAAAYSRDLITWRPQDYPIMSVKPCRRPIIKENEHGDFDIWFMTSDGGKRHLTASADLRRFSADEPVQMREWAWLRDTATIGGRPLEGNLFDISDNELQTIRHYFAQQADEWRKNGERMHDDQRNYPNLQPVSATLTIGDTEKAISDKLIGIFFEDISYAADGGLYAEMVQNRDFEYTPRDRKGWTSTTAWHSPRPITISTDHPLSIVNAHYATIAADSLWNEGWDGMAVEKGKKYDFSIFIRGQKTITVQLVTADGTLIAQSKIKAKSNAWQQYSTTLTAKKTDAKACLLLLPQGNVQADIDMVSLFPRETFMNRKNGLRRDLAETIAALKPKFVRFPGGCMSHGQGLDNIYHWQETIGPLWERKPDMNIWHYHQTRGLGFYEYFQFCEDIGAEPLPVLAAGVPCQNSANNAQGIGGQQGGIPMADMAAYIQELLDLIEWANGDPATSCWAKMRADAGH